jgi:peptide/nickel transport system substrate-binding protein
MVDTYTISPDKLTYTFALRPGLKFHDGQAVTSRDVVASLDRWTKRDTAGQKLREFTAEMKTVDDKTFAIVLKEPFAYVETTLASTSGNAAVIMREQDAKTDPFTAITTTIGSGPFRFVASEWVPGSKVVYEKNPDYVPRSEPAIGFTGGKVVKVDRVEWVFLPDANTRAAALANGEVDMIDQLPHDMAKILERNKNITVSRIGKIDAFGVIRPNSLHPPFNDVRARQALALLVNQNDYLAAGFGDRKWWRENCYSFFVCDTPNGTEAGSENFRKQNKDRAKQLMAEAGYKGEKIVILGTQEIPQIGALAEVTAANLRSIGVDVDLVMSDWGTMLARRGKKDAPEQGGWHIFHTTVGGASAQSPISNFLISATCDGANWPGWPCSPDIEKLRNSFARAQSEAETKATLDALDTQLWKELPVIQTGQYATPFAWRNNITGVLQSPVIAFWNIEKK